LALTAEFRASERGEALARLRDLVVQNLGDTKQGGNALKRYMNSLDRLDRYNDMATFCEAQLKRSVPREIEAYLHRNLAVSYKELGRVEEGLVHFQAALKMSNDDTNLLIPYADLLATEGRHKEAYDHAVRCLRSEPTEIRGYLLVARIQQEMGSRDGARAVLQRALDFADASDKVVIDLRIEQLNALEVLDGLFPPAATAA